MGYFLVGLRISLFKSEGFLLGFFIVSDFEFWATDLAWIEEARFLPLNLQRRAAVALFIHIHMCFSICLLPAACLPIGYFMCCVCPTEMHSFLF